jgi:hypothetical protein
MASFEVIQTTLTEKGTKRRTQNNTTTTVANNKNMTTVLIIVGVLFGVVLVRFLSHTMRMNSRKSEFKDWIVGDKLILKTSSVEYTEIQKLNQTFGNVVGWNVDNIYLKIGNTTHKCEWSCFDSNKSALWRRNYDECKNYVGVDPKVNYENKSVNRK